MRSRTWWATTLACSNFLVTLVPNSLPKTFCLSSLHNGTMTWTAMDICSSGPDDSTPFSPTAFHGKATTVFGSRGLPTLKR